MSIKYNELRKTRADIRPPGCVCCDAQQPANLSWCKVSLGSKNNKKKEKKKKPVWAPFIDWLYSGLCWQLLNCSHLLCFALKPNKSPNRICWHSHKAACHSADWYRANGCVFLRSAVAVYMPRCAIELLRCLTRASAAERSSHYFCFEWKYFTVHSLYVLSVDCIKVQLLTL